VPSFAELLAEVIAEERRFDAFDSPMGANPYAPSARALAVPEAVPFLLEVLEGKHPGAHWAVEALELLGPAGRAAAPLLERLGEARALWSVDEARARALGMHRLAGTWRGAGGETVRAQLARRVVEDARRTRDGVEHARAHFAELLADADPEVVRFALDAADDGSKLEELARSAPAAVPLDAVRPHAGHEDGRIAAAAARVLMTLRRPEDAGRVLDVRRRGLLPRIDHAWLAPHPRSHELYPDAGARDTFELIRRRRCAGLPTALPGDVEARLRGAQGDAEGRELAGRALAELEGRVQRPSTLDEADELFLVTRLEHHDPDAGAYGRYANVLLTDPACAHAALQLAWIDRLYGSPVTAARVEWLRRLGVSDEALLAELTTPGPMLLSGWRVLDRLYPGTQADALAHLERVWRAVRRS
jgi:hypothetical protein